MIQLSNAASRTTPGLNGLKWQSGHYSKVRNLDEGGRYGLPLVAQLELEDPSQPPYSVASPCLGPWPLLLTGASRSPALAFLCPAACEHSVV